MASPVSTGFETWVPPSEPDPEMVQLVQRVLANEAKRELDTKRANVKRAREKLQEERILSMSEAH